MKRPLAAAPATQRGAVLFVSMILLVILTLIGVTAARMQTAEESMARNENNHQLALEYAEAALRNAEGFVGKYQQADFASNGAGLYDLSLELQTTNQSIADSTDWSQPGVQTLMYAGPALNNAPPASQAAQIIIEAMPPVTPVGSQMGDPRYNSPATQIFSYRITTHAGGADASSTATLQSVYQ